MSSKTKELLQMDLYGLLGVENTATLKQIKKAYRHKALKCHPDKNPDNPTAAELFHQLSQALEILTDAAARAAYDKICAAKKQAEERNRKLDDKRKRIKQDLEAREQEAEAQNQEEVRITRTLEEEISRLREEGSRLLEEEQKLIREQIQKEQEDLQQNKTGLGRCSKSSVTPKLKVRWKCKKDDETNGGYSQDLLFQLFHKYGDVLNVVVLTTKRGSALVEFATVRAAELAVQLEHGLSENPLKILWIEGQPEVVVPVSQPGLFTSSQSLLRNERDYESVVMMRMRQAAERQKLIEDMQREDERDADTS